MRWFLPLPICLSACESPCSTEVRQVARDPGTDRYAVTEVRNCGATADFATVVRVGRASQAQDDADEVFVADSNPGEATDGTNGAIWTSVVWTRPGELSIAYPSGARVFERVVTAKGAAITFKATDPYEAPPMP